MRRGVAAAGALVLVLEAFGIAVASWVTGLAVRHQSMSLDGLDPVVMAAGAWVAGGLFAVFLITCGVLLGRAAGRDRAPARFARIVLIGCAVMHGVLGAVAVGPVGWPAFALMMVILGLLTLALLLYGPTGSTGPTGGTGSPRSAGGPDGSGGPPGAPVPAA